LLTKLLDHRNQLKEEKELRKIQRAANILREEVGRGDFHGDKLAAQARASQILKEEKIKEERKREEAKVRLEDFRRLKLEETRNSTLITGSRHSDLTYNPNDFEFENFSSRNRTESDATYSESDSFSIELFIRELIEAQSADKDRKEAETRTSDPFEGFLDSFDKK
jgi:hypothetical protein